MSLRKRWVQLLSEFTPPPKVTPTRQGDVTYPYIAWDHLAETLRPLLAKHGLWLDVSVQDVQVETRNVRDKIAYVARVAVDIALGDVDDNVSVRRYVGEGADYGTGDKAIQKAVTSAVKYYLLKALCAGEPAEDEDGVADAEPGRSSAEKAVAKYNAGGNSKKQSANNGKDGLRDPQRIMALQGALLKSGRWNDVKPLLVQHGGTLDTLPDEELERLYREVKEEEGA